MHDYLRYDPVPSPASYYSREAEVVLRECGELFSALTPYLLEPSNLLAIGGLRAASPYVSFRSADAARIASSSEFSAREVPNQSWAR